MTFDLDESTARVRADAAHGGRRDWRPPPATSMCRRPCRAPPARRRARPCPPPDLPLAWVVAIEEIAAVSGSLAVDAALPGGDGAGARSWMGLRGVDLDGARRARDQRGARSRRGRGAGRARSRRARRRARRTPRGQGRRRAAGAAALGIGRRRHRGRRGAAAALAGRERRAGTRRRRARRPWRGCRRAPRPSRRWRSPGGCWAPRPAAAGTTLDRITRDVATATLVFGGADGEEAAVAAGVLPG